MQNEVVRQVSRMNLPKINFKFGQIRDTLTTAYSCHLFQSKEVPYRNELERIQNQHVSRTDYENIASTSSIPRFPTWNEKIRIYKSESQNRPSFGRLIGKNDNLRTIHHMGRHTSQIRSYSSTIVDPSESTSITYHRKRSRIERVKSMLQKAKDKYWASEQQYDDKLRYLTRTFLASKRYYAIKLNSHSLHQMQQIRLEVAKEAMSILSTIKSGKKVAGNREFEEGCLYIQALAFLEGGRPASEAFEELTRKYNSVLEEIKSEVYVSTDMDNETPRISQRRNATYMAIEAIIESCYHDSSDGEVLIIAERLLSNQTVLDLNRNAIHRRRGRFNPLIWRIRYPYNFIRKFIKNRQNDIKTYSESITSVITALCSNNNLTDAVRIYGWANRMGMTHNLRLSIRLLRELTKVGQDRLGDEVEDILKKDLSQEYDERATYLGNSIIALRCARRGDSVALEQALSIYDRSGGRNVKREAKEDFMQKMRILNHCERGEVEECFALLSQRYDMDGLFRGITSICRTEGGDKRIQDPRQEPDAYACTILVRAFIRADLVNEAELVIERLSQGGSRIPIPIFNDLLHHYVKRDDFASAMSLFDELNSGDVPLSKETYNAMITLFARKGDIESTNKVIQLALSKGVKNVKYFFTGLLQAHIEARSWKGAVKVFEQMLQSSDPQCRPDHVTFTSMLRLHVLCGMPIQTTCAFLETILQAGFTPSPHTFTILLVSAWDANSTELAEQIFTLTERYLGGRGGRPTDQGANAYHFTVMIKGYLAKKESLIARQYLDELVKRKEHIDGVLRSIIVGAYTRGDESEEGRLEGMSVAQQLADHFAEEIPSQSSIISQPVLRHATRLGDVDQIESIIRDMVKREVDVPIHVWSELLNALRKNSDVEGALHVWETIFDKALEREARIRSSAINVNRLSDLEDSRDLPIKVLPSMRHILCSPLSRLIDVLTSAERFDDIAKIWLDCRKHGFAFDSHNWNHLTVALFRAGRIVDACKIIERVLNGDPPSLWSPTLLMAAYEDAMVSDPDHNTQNAKEGFDRNTKGNEEAIQLPEFEGESEMLFGSAARDQNQAQTGSRPLRSLYRFPPDDPLVQISEGLLNRFEGSSSTSIIEPTIEESEEGQEDEGFDQELSQSYDELFVGMNANELLGPLKAKQVIERVRSPWFAHFQTLSVLKEVLDQAHLQDDLITLPPKSIIQSLASELNHDQTRERDGTTISVQQLFKTHPRLEQILKIFDRRLEEVRERERKPSSRSPDSAGNYKSKFFDISNVGFGDRGNDEQGKTELREGKL